MKPFLLVMVFLLGSIATQAQSSIVSKKLSVETTATGSYLWMILDFDKPTEKEQKVAIQVWVYSEAQKDGKSTYDWGWRTFEVTIPTKVVSIGWAMQQLKPSEKADPTKYKMLYFK